MILTCAFPWFKFIAYDNQSISFLLLGIKKKAGHFEKEEKSMFVLLLFNF